MRDAIYRNIEEGSTIHTDESPVFDGVGGLFYTAPEHQPHASGNIGTTTSPRTASRACSPF
jgi:hypothetical protein